jgi:hypothetical protein
MNIGRPGEVAYLALDTLTWDYEFRAVRGDWPLLKTRGTKETLFMSDSKHYVRDQHWLSFVYYMSGAALPQTATYPGDFIFADLHEVEENNKSAAARAITSSLLKLQPTQENRQKNKGVVCEELYVDNVSARGLRSGSIMNMAMQVDIQHVATKSGHYFHEPGISSIWEYFYLNDISLAIATKALCGWPSKGNVFPPDLSIIRNANNQKNNQAISNWLHSLLNDMYSVSLRPNLRPIVDVWLATFLMYLHRFVRDCREEYCVGTSPYEHHILRTFKTKTERFFSMEECFKFGEILLNDFESKNSHASKDSSSDNLMELVSSIFHQRHVELITSLSHIDGILECQGATIREQANIMKRIETEMSSVKQELSIVNNLLKVCSHKCNNHISTFELVLFN